MSYLFADRIIRLAFRAVLSAVPGIIGKYSRSIPLLLFAQRFGYRFCQLRLTRFLRQDSCVSLGYHSLSEHDNSSTGMRITQSDELSFFIMPKTKRGNTAMKGKENTDTYRCLNCGWTMPAEEQGKETRPLSQLPLGHPRRRQRRKRMRRDPRAGGSRIRLSRSYGTDWSLGQKERRMGGHPPVPQMREDQFPTVWRRMIIL